MSKLLYLSGNMSVDRETDVQFSGHPFVVYRLQIASNGFSSGFMGVKDLPTQVNKVRNTGTYFAI